MTSRTGKTYVITGGISGLGLAAAKLLYGQGANGTKAWYLVRCC
jgi:NAD(P)-dependent dehydrogenase (short-subunit alcohol dehydrogenase family)